MAVEYDFDSEARKEAAINRGELSPRSPYIMAIIFPNVPEKDVVSEIIDAWQDKVEISESSGEYILNYINPDDKEDVRPVMYAGGGRLILLGGDEDMFKSDLRIARTNIKNHGGRTLISTLQMDNRVKHDIPMSSVFVKRIRLEQPALEYRKAA